MAMARIPPTPMALLIKMPLPTMVSVTPFITFPIPGILSAARNTAFRFT